MPSVLYTTTGIRLRCTNAMPVVDEDENTATIHVTGALGELLPKDANIGPTPPAPQAAVGPIALQNATRAQLIAPR